QLGLAALNHHDTHKFFPSAGWSWQWVPVPDNGAGASQPGSWNYQLLPFMEEQSLASLGKGVTNATTLEQLMTTLVSTPVAGFICPSRRAAAAYPYARDGIGPLASANLKSCIQGNCQVARGDYAANSGNIHAAFYLSPGPGSPTTATGWKGFNW